jgi:hypothetical protein
VESLNLGISALTLAEYDQVQAAPLERKSSHGRASHGRAGVSILGQVVDVGERQTLSGLEEVSKRLK